MGTQDRCGQFAQTHLLITDASEVVGGHLVPDAPAGMTWRPPGMLGLPLAALHHAALPDCGISRDCGLYFAAAQVPLQQRCTRSQPETHGQ